MFRRRGDGAWILVDRWGGRFPHRRAGRRRLAVADAGRLPLRPRLVPRRVPLGASADRAAARAGRRGARPSEAALLRVDRADGVRDPHRIVLGGVWRYHLRLGAHGGERGDRGGGLRALDRARPAVARTSPPRRRAADVDPLHPRRDDVHLRVRQGVPPAVPAARGAGAVAHLRRVVADGAALRMCSR